MKKICFIVFVFCFHIAVWGQAKKPTIMVLPSDPWMTQNNFMQSITLEGTTKLIPNYQKALSSDQNLYAVITELGSLMADRGFPLKQLSQVLKDIDNDNAENQLTTSKSGSEIAQNPIDILKQTAMADILIYIDWQTTTIGPKQQITFTLNGTDAYTDKQIAAATGTGAPSFSAIMPVLLKEAVVAQIDGFNAQLQNYFDDLFKNGREVILKVKVWQDFNGDLESNYNGKELNEIIEDWVANHTVKSRYNLSTATQNIMKFEQVRIPLYDSTKNNRPMDTRSWTRGLQGFLEKTCNIDVKLTTNGLGEAGLIIGGK